MTASHIPTNTSDSGCKRSGYAETAGRTTRRCSGNRKASGYKQGVLAWLRFCGLCFSAFDEIDELFELFGTQLFRFDKEVDELLIGIRKIVLDKTAHELLFVFVLR